MNTPDNTSGLHIAYVSMHTSPTASPGSADAGGMNVVELNSALALARRGHRVDLITRREDHTTPHIMPVADNVRLITLAAGPEQPCPKSAQEPLIDPFSQALENFVSTEPTINLIHSHHWFSGVAALPVAHKHSIAHVQSFHSLAAPVGQGLQAGELPESPGRRAGERLAAQESDVIIAVSHAEKQQIIAHYAAEPDNISVVIPGVNTNLFRPLRTNEQPWRPATRRPYIMFAARLQPLKGPDLAIRAVGCIDPALRPTLVIAGAESADFREYGQELRTLVKQLGLDDDVIFVGAQSRQDLAEKLRSASLLLIPSYIETFGLISLEAQASGTPVLAANVGGIPETLIPHQTGILLDDRDPNHWSQAITRVLNDKDFQRSLSAHARAFAETLTWDESAQHLSDTYLPLAKQYTRRTTD